MRIRDYLIEAMSEEAFDKKFNAIERKYQRQYKKVINQIFKTDYNGGIYREWDDISYYAMVNAGIEKLSDEQMRTAKFLRDYERSLDAILDQAEDDLDLVG